MSLGSALQIGRTALAASQAAIEVAGNNLANIATEGYHRQVAVLSPLQSDQITNDMFMGRGVQVEAIVRQIDEALETRLRSSVSDQTASHVTYDVLSQIEALQSELSDVDLSTHLSDFFNAWSELANSPDDLSQRNIAIQQGESLALFVQDMAANLTQIRNQLDTDLAASVTSANDLLTQIEDINQRIVDAEQGSGGAYALRDQRDAMLSDLSEYFDISVNELKDGAVDVFVGSLPVILNGQSRGLELRQQSVDGVLQTDVLISADQSVLAATSGKIGAQVTVRDTDVADALEQLNELAAGIIYEVNRLHTQGQGTTGFSEVQSVNGVLDPTVALNDVDTGLAFVPGHGSFQIHLTETATGQRTTETIRIDLDGIDPANDTTMNDLAAAIGAIDGISASVDANGRLNIRSDSAGHTISFSDDTSGVLACLGINTFFTGSSALDIGVNEVVAGNPSLLAATLDHEESGNRGALAIAALRDTRLDSLNGQSLSSFWQRHIEDFAVRLGQARQQYDSDTLVRESLEAQQQQVSGVNSDEETINLLAFQRAYQGSAQFLSIIDQMLETLIELV